MSARPLNAYMAFAGDPGEGAALVFARTSAEARRIAGPTVISWSGCDWIDVRVRRLKAHGPYLATLADALALAEGRPHVVESPAMCERCERWGNPPHPDGGCVGCVTREVQSA